MPLLFTEHVFNIQHLLFGEDNYKIFPQVVLRAIIMFIVVLISLRILGKRGVKQLSIFELVIILTLGSAAGDPMFYDNVGLLPAILVFVVIILLYRILIYIADKNERFNRFVEGKPTCLVESGKICFQNFTHESIVYDEMFAQMRLQQVTHLGQIRKAYIETSGELSIFFYPDTDVKSGMPIWPEALDAASDEISQPGIYSCTLCGYTASLPAGKHHTCPECNKHKWTHACDDLRTT